MRPLRQRLALDAHDPYSSGATLIAKNPDSNVRYPRKAIALPVNCALVVSDRRGPAAFEGRFCASDSNAYEVESPA